MTQSSHEPTLSLDAASAAWDLLADKVQVFSQRWQQSAEPPEFADLLPIDQTPLRRLILVELIKIDLPRRWENALWRKPLEDYASRFPELCDAAGLPLDLIYEEFFVRKQAGESVSADEYAARFPAQAADVQRVLLESSVHATTALVPAVPVDEIGPDQRVDDFDLLVQLGKGAFATVFLARQRSLGRMVALKISADRGFETQTLAQLDHPHIVRVYDQRLWGERQLRLMYMQYVAGGTLQGVVERVRRTPPAERRGTLLLTVLDEALAERGESPPSDSRSRHLLERMDWASAVCWLGARLASALDYAHGQGVLHRDLKPANILLAADAAPKLADFNISFSSRVAGDTAAAYFGGSLAYMSPEQLEACSPGCERTAEDLDGRSDLYSLGVVLWELLTGQRPFRDEQLAGFSPGALAHMIERRRQGPDVQAIAQLAAVCPPGLVALLQRCLAFDRNERFDTLRQLARQLEFCLQPQVERLLRSGNTGWVARLRRHPLVGLLVAGVVPNALLSALNIVYNLEELIRGRAEFLDLRQQVFQQQVVVVNPLFYGVAIGVLLGLAWPMLTAVKRLAAGEPPASIAGFAAEAPRYRTRAANLGQWVAWVTATGWIISGVVFPLWLHLAGAGLMGKEWLHFFASQLLCGLMTASVVFASVTLLCLRVYCPVLLDQQADDPATAEAIETLARRAPRYALLAYATPLLGMFAMYLLDIESRTAFGVFSATGLLASLGAYVAGRAIQRDCAALHMAASPESAPSLASVSSDSFWSASR